VGAFGVVEPQGAGDGVQDRVGGAAGIAALQPGVVRDADPGQQRDLLAAQTCDPACPGERETFSPACSGVIRARREVRKSRISVRRSIP
jgi:hypothetical protein